MELPLTEQDKIDLKKLHRQIKEKQRKRQADRIKIITMLDKGFSEVQISELLMLDEETISAWRNKFFESKTTGEFMNLKYWTYPRF